MTVNRIAPGMPNMLTNIMVKKFNPIWKLKKPPIKLISKMMITPIKEFRKSFIMNFRGRMKILHKTNIMHRPDMYVKILINSICKSPRPFCTYYDEVMEFIRKSVREEIYFPDASY